jgi:putative transposase
MCQVLGVSASGYYAWSRRPESAHTQRDRQLQVLVRASCEASKHRYGSPRIHEDLLEQDAGQSQACDSVDAGGRAEGAGPEAVQMHDDE